MQQTKLDYQCHFGDNIALNVVSVLTHAVVSTAVYVNDVMQSSQLVYDEEINIYDDVGSFEVTKRKETQVIIPQWHMAMRDPGKRCALNMSTIMVVVSLAMRSRQWRSHRPQPRSF